MWVARIVECLGVTLALICFFIGLTKIIASIMRGWNDKKKEKKDEH
jgi:hypothetical protein